MMMQNVRSNVTFMTSNVGPMVELFKTSSTYSIKHVTLMTISTLLDCRKKIIHAKISHENDRMLFH